MSNSNLGGAVGKQYAYSLLARSATIFE